MTRRTRPYRRTIQWTLLVVGLVGFCELTCFVAFWFLDGRSFSFERVLAEQDDLRWTPGSADAAPLAPPRAAQAAAEVIHPYVGYVTTPVGDGGAAPPGFRETESVIRKRADDRVILAVTGGSLASDFATAADSVLLEGLRGHPFFRGKEVVVLDLASGGYKQPQQLMILSYLLALGAEFDIVVNIDGFNEVALHASENGTKGVFPAYPRNWYMRARGLTDSKTLPIAGQIVAVRLARERWAGQFARLPLRRSVTLCFLWRVRDGWFRARLAQANRALRELKGREDDYERTGPDRAFASDDELYEELAAIWRRGSVQLDSLCRSNSIRYLHFLQPNQYVPDAKPMTREEEETALFAQHPYRKGVVDGYPHLRRAGRELAERGVAFHDLTLVFSDVRQAVYRDDCCHLNDRGNEIVGSVVARAIVAAIDAPPGDS